MENNEIMEEVMETEVVEETAAKVATTSTGKTLLIGIVIGVGGTILVKHIAKPVIRKIRSKMTTSSENFTSDDDYFQDDGYNDDEEA